jgi:hypothetical protein
LRMVCLLHLELLADIWLTPDGAYLYQIYGKRLETGGLRRPTGWFARRGHQREHSVQQPAGLDRILIPPQRLTTTRVVTVVVLMVASAWALQSSLRAEQAVNRRPMKIERSSPI